MTEIVTTKSEKGSTSETKIKKVKFADLWSNYPSSRIKHDKDGKGTDFANHCAINVSTSLYKSGVKLKAFPRKRKCWGCPTPDDKGKGIHALAAQDLADYLKKKPFFGCPAPTAISPKDLYSGIDGKKGIIFFKDYWLRGSSRTGDHIDLWDGNELASLGYLQSHIRRWFPSFSEDYLGMSDFERCKSILFWEMA